MRSTNRSGFTLLELMVAMVIFAMLGVVSQQLLRNSIETKDAITERSQALTEIQKAIRILRDDFGQMAMRDIRNEKGETEPAIKLQVPMPKIKGEKEKVYLIVFTKNGWANPMDLKRSSLQRVAYAFQDGKLIRYFWPVLDRAQNIEPQAHVLLGNLQSASINFGDTKENEFPNIVEIMLQHESFGEIKLKVQTASSKPAPIKEEEKKNPSGNQINVGGNAQQ